jgi:hypothetical protein
MRRIALLAIVVAVASACTADPYADLRQRSPQPIPGTLAASLLPPGDADPAIDAAAARAGAALPADAEADVALARVHDGLEALETDPAWVFVARGVCIREDKGELVSDARGAVPGDDLACTPATFLLVAIDATTGASLLTITGYDESLTWRPDVETAAPAS